MTKARELWELAAVQGQAQAQNNLGSMYKNGQGVAQEFTKAREWYELAAAQGDAPAQNNIGVMYREGQGVAQDFTKAREWYALAAAQGNAGAQCNLGFMHLSHGVEQDLNEAMRWFLKAKAHGQDVSQEVAAVMELRQLQNAQSQETRIPGPATGTEVEVTGLVNRPELNGVRGRVLRYISGKDRWLNVVGGAE